MESFVINSGKLITRALFVDEIFLIQSKLVGTLKIGLHKCCTYRISRKLLTKAMNDKQFVYF